MTSDNPIIPALRWDLQIEQNADQSLLIIQDPEDYLEGELHLPSQLLPLLLLFDGRHRLSELQEAMAQQDKEKEEASALVQRLDAHYVLQSAHFFQEKEAKMLDFERSDTLSDRFSGTAYPKEKEALQQMLRPKPSERPFNGHHALVYMPHIDFRVNTSVYHACMAPFVDQSFDHVLILATSHYSGLYPAQYEGFPFISSTKNFHGTLGNVTVNQTALNSWLISDAESVGLSFHDRAFMQEHSVEFHLMMAQLCLKPGFDYLPILVGSLDECLLMDNGDQAVKTQRMAEKLRNILEKQEGRTLVLISGDLSHVGPRFGDKFDAADQLEAIKMQDQRFMQALLNGSSDALIDAMRPTMNGTQICGLPPALLALEAFGKHIQDATLISNEYWYEEDDRSLVSFGGLYAELTL